MCVGDVVGSIWQALPALEQHDAERLNRDAPCGPAGCGGAGRERRSLRISVPSLIFLVPRFCLLIRRPLFVPSAAPVCAITPLVHQHRVRRRHAVVEGRLNRACHIRRMSLDTTQKTRVHEVGTMSRMMWRVLYTINRTMWRALYTMERMT